MYSFMCCFSALEHIVHYKAKNPNTIKTNFCQARARKTVPFSPVLAQYFRTVYLCSFIYLFGSLQGGT